MWEADQLYLDLVGRDTFYGLLASLRGQLFRDADFRRECTTATKATVSASRAMPAPRASYGVNFTACRAALVDLSADFANICLTAATPLSNQGFPARFLVRNIWYGHRTS